MSTRTQPVDLDAWFANTLGGAGNGNGKYMSAGLGTASWAWINRCAVRVPRGSLFAGLTSSGQISGAYLNIRLSGANTGIGGSVKLYIQRATGTFTAQVVTAGANGVPSGAAIDAYVISAGPASGHYPGPASVTTDQGTYTGSPSSGTWLRIPLTNIAKWWFGQTGDLTLLIVAQDETQTNQRATFWTADSGSVPYFEVDVNGNNPPLAPSNVVVTYPGDGTSFTVTADYTDPDGDTSPQFEAVFTPDAST